MIPTELHNLHAAINFIRRVRHVASGCLGVRVGSVVVVLPNPRIPAGEYTVLGVTAGTYTLQELVRRPDGTTVAGTKFPRVSSLLCTRVPDFRKLIPWMADAELGAVVATMCQNGMTRTDLLVFADYVQDRHPFLENSLHPGHDACTHPYPALSGATWDGIADALRILAVAADGETMDLFGPICRVEPFSGPMPAVPRNSAASA